MFFFLVISISSVWECHLCRDFGLHIKFIGIALAQFFFFLQLIFCQRDQSNIWTAPGLCWLVDSWLWVLIIGWWQWGGTSVSDDWWLVLPQLAVARMCVLLLSFCECVCGVEISQGMAAWPKMFLGKKKNLREWWKYVCLLNVPVCISPPEWECVCVFSAGGRHESISSPVMQLQPWLTGYVIHMPNSHLPKRVHCFQWNEGKRVASEQKKGFQVNVK